MKKYLFLPAVLCMAASGCQPSDAPQNEELSSHRAGVLYGVSAKGETSTVAVMEPESGDAFHDGVCSPAAIARCKEEFGNAFSCIIADAQPVCMEICGTPGERFTQCRMLSSGSYQLGYTCMDYGSEKVWTQDLNHTKYCLGKCDSSGEKCDEKGGTDFIRCTDEEIRICSGMTPFGKLWTNTCVANTAEVYCTVSCDASQVGSTISFCSPFTTGDGLVTAVCSRVGKDDYAYTVDYEQSYYCANACESLEKCDASGVGVPMIYGRTRSAVQRPQGSAICTGTLIHPQWVLTAAHCVAEWENGRMVPLKRNGTVKIGIGDSRNNMIAFDTEGVGAFYWHEDYRFDGSGVPENDIALIRLRTPVPSSVAEPVPPLPKWFGIRSADLPLTMQTSGFGVTETGRSGNKMTVTRVWTHYCGAFNPSDLTKGCYVGSVDIVGCHPHPDYCKYYGEYNLRDVDVSIPYGTLYAPVDPGGTCSGDSGGPTYREVGGRRYVAGVTSYGDTPCRAYNIATSVVDYYDWIVGIAPDVASLYREICGNGLDDDGNGMVDAEDAACSGCGNGVVDPGEECDGSRFLDDKTTCPEWNSSVYASGNMRCNKDCTVNYFGCSKVRYCGNGLLNSGEECDRGVFAGNRSTCAQWDSKYTSGNLACNADCTVDDSACTSNIVCGDGVISGDEDCDGDSFPGGMSSCDILYPELYSGGRVTCSDACTYDTSGCESWCGNGVINGKFGEVCDHGANGDVFTPKSGTCEKVVGEGSTGVLKCAPNCRSLDISGCTKLATCGNGRLDAGEDCDGSVFAGDRTLCGDWDSKYVRGQVTCNANCTIAYELCEDDGTHAGLDPVDPENPPDGADKSKSSDSDCSSVPLVPSNPTWIWLFGLLGAGAWMRRRRENR